MTCVFYVLLSAGWFCSEECSHDREEIDHVLEHSQSLLLELLLVAANHDCVREGDGPGMIRMWKSQMVQFWQKNHPKYVIASHLLLAGKDIGRKGPNCSTMCPVPSNF